MTTLAPEFHPVSMPDFRTTPMWTEVIEPDDEDWVSHILESVASLERLPPNWDSYGSRPPDTTTIRVAMVLVFIGWEYLRGGSPPDVIPLSGGGIQIIWRGNDRQVELDVFPQGRITALKIEDDEPVGDDMEVRLDRQDVEAVLAWL